jgi:hypothetical protein
MRTWPRTQPHRISASEHPSFVSSKVSWQIRGSAAEESGYVDPPIACQVEKAATGDLFDQELVAGPSEDGRAWSNILSRDRRARGGAADRKKTIAIKPDGAASERPLECRGIERVSNDGIYGAKRE